MKKRWIFLMAGGLALLSLGFIFSRELEVEEITLQFEHLPPELEGFRIVHLADWQIPKNLVTLEDLVEVVGQQNPDLIVLSGDMIDRSARDFSDMQELAALLPEIAPTYAVSGNHEFNNRGNWREAYGDLPIIDETYVDFGSWLLVGAQDDMPMPEVPEGYFTILLAHRPRQYPADLTFSGHVHGGHWKLPWIGGLLSPDHLLFPRFTNGVYSFDDGTKLVLSRGIGNSILPLRFLNRPHIIVITLERTAI
ncbi:MAG: metallophosphoesterase [Turicibacter sp.]|nr:metallophosphoesterase [Turicibacter sp.]